jgi:uncharacterized membrane protein YbhN (UPF0104 family)
MAFRTPTLSTPARWALRITAFVLGAALTVAAVMYAAQGVAWEQLADARPWQVAAIAAGVVVNLLLTGLLWWLVTRSFDADPPVPLGRMTVLIAACELLNYLPLRAGMFGRAAYLKTKHKVPVRQSVVMVFATMGLTLVVFAVVVTALLAAGEVWQWLLAAGAVALLSVASLWLTPLLLRRPVFAAWAWPLVRVADLLTASARLWVALGVVGESVSFAHAVIAAAAGLLVRPISITPNALGIREWFVGVVAGEIAVDGYQPAVAAALIDRAVEVVIMTVIGLPAMALLRGGTRSGDQEIRKSGD